MPQLNKGGKYVFGLSIISPENKIKIPDDTLKTYLQDNENKRYYDSTVFYSFWMSGVR